jgi:hypothetical protein
MASENVEKLADDQPTGMEEHSASREEGEREKMLKNGADENNEKAKEKDAETGGLAEKVSRKKFINKLLFFCRNSIHRLARKKANKLH